MDEGSPTRSSTTSFTERLSLLPAKVESTRVMHDSLPTVGRSGQMARSASDGTSHVLWVTGSTTGLNALPAKKRVLTASKLGVAPLGSEPIGSRKWMVKMSLMLTLWPW